MTKKLPRPTFEQALATLRQHGFEVRPFPAIAGAMLVAKSGAAGVLVPSQLEDGSAAVFEERPGILVRGEIARLLDRGYQKFIKTSQYELPATAAQLHAIHQLSEDLSGLIGVTSLYNESLGTTSDLYQYDRLHGRKDDAAPAAGRPWEAGDGH